MPVGGRRPGAGRPPGAKNKRTAEIKAAALEADQAAAELIPDAFEGDAHAFLMLIYKDPSRDIELRIDAAKAAIRYEKPALAAIDHSGELSVIRDIGSEPLSDDEWASQHTTSH